MDAPSALPQQTTPSSPAVTDVLGNDVLFPLINSFLPGLPTWLVTLQRTHGPVIKALEHTLAAKRSSGTPGLLPYLAIQECDLRTLNRLWVLHKQREFRKNPRFWFHSAMSDAATMGKIEALVWLYEKTNMRCGSLTLALAASHGHADVVQWLFDGHLPEGVINATYIARAIVQAAANGQLEVLKVLHKSWSTMSRGDGQFSLVDAFDAAVKHGHVDVVRWFVTEQGERFSSVALRGAVSNGHIPVVQFLWDKHQSASKGDDDDSRTQELRKAIRAGVPSAIRRADLAMLRFLNDRIGTDVFSTYTLGLVVQLSQDFSVFRFVHDMGRPQEDLDHALRSSTAHVERMQFLLMHNTFSLETMVKVLEHAKGLCDKDKTRASVEVLKSAIAQKQQELLAPCFDVGSVGLTQPTSDNWFAPVTSKATSGSPTRHKAKARRPVPRGTSSARGRAFLAPVVAQT